MVFSTGTPKRHPSPSLTEKHEEAFSWVMTPSFPSPFPGISEALKGSWFSVDQLKGSTESSSCQVWKTCHWKIREQQQKLIPCSRLVGTTQGFAYESRVLTYRSHSWQTEQRDQIHSLFRMSTIVQSEWTRGWTIRGKRVIILRFCGPFLTTTLFALPLN